MIMIDSSQSITTLWIIGINLVFFSLRFNVFLLFVAAVAASYFFPRCYSSRNFLAHFTPFYTLNAVFHVHSTTTITANRQANKIAAHLHCGLLSLIFFLFSCQYSLPHTASDQTTVFYSLYFCHQKI